MDKTGVFQFHFPSVLTESCEWYKIGPMFNLVESLAPSCLPPGSWHWVVRPQFQILPRNVHQSFNLLH